MMNKAEKRKLEIIAYSDAYNLIESYRDSQLRDMEFWKDTKKEILEENPEADTEWHDEHIEKLELQFNASQKVMEVILKLM